MPPKAKRQSAHQHDRRHETGLAQPGRRITKQRSSGHLNEHVSVQPKSRSQLTTGATQSEANRTNSTAYASGTDESTRQAQFRPTLVSSGGVLAEGQTRASSDVSLDEIEDVQISDDDFEDSASVSYRYANIDTKKLKSVQGGKTLHSITTIISVCPLRDIVAILIILLQLPPTILTVTQFLFATLTFLPPTSIATLPSVSEILAGSGGMPSLATMVVTDIIILLAWLLMWVPAQNLILDLAQAVIAIALGGAAAGRGGTTHSMIVCLTVILLSHAFRSKPARNYGMSLLWTQLGHKNAGYTAIPPSTAWFADTLYVPRSWPRSILGIHIFTQGLVRVVRRALARKEPIKLPKPGKKMDSEIFDDSRLSRSSSISTDANIDTTISVDGDRRQSGSASNTKEGKDKGTSSRRRRKPANAIRMRQPFWATLASTKITVCKEIENREAVADAIEANTSSLSDVADSNFVLGEGRVWVSGISATGISFGACVEDPDESFNNQKEAGCSDIDGSIAVKKPFYIRVNGAEWSSTKIQHVGQGGNDGRWKIWTGEIIGLTPLSSYRCEFLRNTDDDVLYSVSVVTHAASAAEKDKYMAPNVTEPLRPSSPLSTLKKSTAAAEQKVQEYRSRLKRARKEHKSNISTLRKEVDNLTSRKTSTIANDDKLRQRELQLQQNIQHLEHATSSIADEIDVFGNIPEEDRTKAKEAKARWEAAQDADEASRAQLKSSKRKGESELEVVRGDIASALQKRDRLQTRRAKLNEQHDRLLAKNNEDAENRARIADQMAAQDAHRANIEAQYITSIETCERQTIELSQKTQAAMQQLQQLEALMAHQQQHPHLQQTAAIPSSFVSLPQSTTPDGSFPTTINADAISSAASTNTAAASIVDRSPTASPLHALNFPAAFEPYIATTPPRTSNGINQPTGNHTAAVTSTSNMSGTSRSRLRSSSMLSAVSNFTDDFEPPAPGAGAAAIGTRPKSGVAGETSSSFPAFTTTSRSDSTSNFNKDDARSRWNAGNKYKAKVKSKSGFFVDDDDDGGGGGDTGSATSGNVMPVPLPAPVPVPLPIPGEQKT